MVILAAAAGLLILRLAIYQIVQWGDQLPIGQPHTGADARGVIVDRNGTLLAADRFFYEVAITPNILHSDEERREVANQLEELAGMPANRTLAMLQEYQDSSFLRLAETVPLAAAEAIEARQEEIAKTLDRFPLQYVFITPVPLRYYPQNELASHILGFVNAERSPFYGVESYYDRYLLADSGIGFTTAPQAELSSLSPSLRRYMPSQAGKDIVLTIDSAIQWIVEEELKKGVEEFKAERGTVIIQNPHTGEILAMASYPSYDPNRFGDTATANFLDPAISQQYEPGSIFKVITMAAGLDAEVMTPDKVYNDPGFISIGERTIFNSQLIGYGEVEARDALALSLNVVTAQVAVDIGTSQFYDYVRRFGFGSPTEVDLAGEVPGAIKVPGDPMWSPSDLGTNSFGQGIAVTPLQMVNSVSALANGGKLMRPYVVKERVYDGKVLVTEPTVIHTAISSEHADQIADMMVHAVEIGNKKARVDDYTVAGKSGTAQIPTVAGYLEDQVNASFVGFAPAEEPAVVMLVRLERPDQEVTLWASDNAAPIFSRIMTRVLSYLNVEPNSRRMAGE
jgi:cell division protein FtsI/penicillin-binding protein 2